MDEDNNLESALDDVGKLFIKTLTDELKKVGKNATGNLIKSLSYTNVVKADKITTSILALDYLQDVDLGRKKGKQPPVKSIIPWVKKKNIKIKGAKTDEDAAFVIARSIGKKGIKPTNVVNKAKEKVLKDVEKILAIAAEKDIEQQINNLFKDI